MAFIDRVMDVFFTIKGISLSLRLGSFLGFLSKPFAFFSNYLALTKFISKNNKRGVMNDFFVPIRRKGVRDEYYQYLLMQHKLNEQNITYLEFGVYKGSSMRWWVNQNKMEGSFFAGFDTFEGLPEAWGPYAKGGMKADMPEINDDRIEFVKGLFQDTLYNFIERNKTKLAGRLVINLDADLFSATIFALATLNPYLKKGDIIMFDEFNVPNHEYLAYKIFTESFPIKLKLAAARLNFYHTAFVVE